MMNSGPCAPQDFKYKDNSVKAVQCLNDMVTNALLHVEDCLQYMSALKDPAIFRFCAIPQVYFNLKLVVFLSHTFFTLATLFVVGRRMSAVSCPFSN